MNINQTIRDKLRLVSDSDLIWIKPIKKSNTRKNDCHKIVNEKLRLGGDHLYGWCITHLKDEYIELLYHTVWVKGGKIFDFTPIGDNGIDKKLKLFLPDNERKMEYLGEVNGYHRFSTWETIFWNPKSGGWRTANSSKVSFDISKKVCPEAMFTIRVKTGLNGWFHNNPAPQKPLRGG